MGMELQQLMNAQFPHDCTENKNDTEDSTENKNEGFS